MICKREILAPYVINHHIKAGQTITRDRTLTRLAPNVSEHDNHITESSINPLFVYCDGALLEYVTFVYECSFSSSRFFRNLKEKKTKDIPFVSTSELIQ